MATPEAKEKINNLHVQKDKRATAYALARKLPEGIRQEAVSFVKNRHRTRSDIDSFIERMSSNGSR